MTGSRRARQPEPEPEKHRSDFGTRKLTTRDWKGLPFVAEQQFVRYDTLGGWWDPGHEPATHESRQQQAKEGQKPGRGGKRTGLPWPKDYHRRLAAVTRIVDERWVPMGLAESFQPFAGQPKWVRLTDLGYRILGLPWRETPFPEDLRTFWHDRERRSHIHCINQIRVYLAGGGAHAPKHTWISERALEAEQPLKEAGMTLPHLPDGVMGSAHHFGIFVR